MEDYNTNLNVGKVEMPFSFTQILRINYVLGMYCDDKIFSLASRRLQFIGEIKYKLRNTVHSNRCCFLGKSRLLQKYKINTREAGSRRLGGGGTWRAGLGRTNEAFSWRG